MMRRELILAILVGATSVTACNLIAGIQERDLESGKGGAGPASSSVASATSTTSGSGGIGGASMTSSTSSVGGSGTGGEGGASDAGDDVVVVKCSTLYVSAAGSDDEDGCDSAKPKKTITAALASAKISKSVTTVEVCGGTYSEPLLTLSIPVSLLGGFKCSDWTRTNDYGYPTFNPANQSIIQNQTLSAGTPYTVYLNGVSLTNKVKLDGFTIQGPASGVAASAALAIRGNATPTVSNNQILGGGTTSTNAIASTGVYVDTGAAPIITKNTIDGGSGKTSSNYTGSVGVELSVVSGAPVIQGNTISGGSGSESFAGGGIGSVGISVTGALTMTVADGNAIQDNVINGGTGACDGDGTPSIGVRVQQNATVDIVDNTIDGGKGTNGNNGTFAIDFVSTGGLRVIRNRVNGGQNQSNTLLWGARAIYAHGASSLQVVNNMVLGGDASIGGGDTPALTIDKVTGAVIQQNTFVGGLSTTGYSGQIDLSATVVGAVIQNNILAGYGQSSSAGLYLRGCASTGIVQTFQNNFIFNEAGDLMRYDAAVGAGCASGSIGTIDALQTALLKFAAATVSGNKTMAPTGMCAGDTGCIVAAGCTSATACFDVVFGAWDAASNGLVDLLGTGWKLAPTVPCAVAKSSLDLTATVSDDLFGDPRVAPSSMGADQQNVSCK